VNEPGSFPVRHLGIVGVGLIGGSVAMAARRAWPDVRVAGIDRGAALDSARLITAFDVLADTVDVLRGADLVVMAAPVSQNIALLPALGAILDQPALITDTGSTKRATVAAAAGLPAHLTFVGGHPLAGAARGGLALARGDLFVGRPWLLTPGSATRTPSDVERVERFVNGLGGEPRIMDAADHDRLFAFLSHLPQLAASALMHTVGGAVGDRIDLAGPGLVDTTRLATSPADIWQDICATNADAIGPALDAFIAALTDLRDNLDRGDAVPRVFGSAARWREAIGAATPRE
jgi:prephenate dehydrogenase